MLCSQICYICDQERSCPYDMGIYFARYQIKIIARNYMSKCERVAKAFIRVSAGVKHRNVFFRKKMSNKYVILAKNLAIFLTLKIVVEFMFTLLMKQFHSYGITPVNKFGAVFE